MSYTIKNIQLSTSGNVGEWEGIDLEQVASDFNALQELVAKQVEEDDDATFYDVVGRMWEEFCGVGYYDSNGLGRQKILDWIEAQF